MEASKEYTARKEEEEESLAAAASLAEDEGVRVVSKYVNVGICFLFSSVYK